MQIMNNGTKIIIKNEVHEFGFKHRVTLDQMRLLHLAISKIDSKNKKPQTTYKIFASEYKKIFGISKHGGSLLEEAALSLFDNPIKVYEFDSRGKLQNVFYPWFSRLAYHVHDAAFVEFRFSGDAEKYLYEIKDNYTEVDFEQLAKLNTTFSMRLYIWLCQVRHMKNAINAKGQRRVTLNVKWMKERAGLDTDFYSAFKEFNKRHLKPAVELINRETDLALTANTIKQGNFVTDVEFSYSIKNEIKTALIEQGKSKVTKDKKVTKPTLKKRPQVAKGSGLEKEWIEGNIRLLIDYEQRLEAVGERLTKYYIDKLINYYTAIGDNTNAKRYQQKRSTKKKSAVQADLKNVEAKVKPKAKKQEQEGFYTAKKEHEMTNEKRQTGFTNLNQIKAMLKKKGFR